MKVIKKVAPDKNKTIKRNSQEWFDSEFSEKLIIWNKFFRKYKQTRCHVEKEIIKEHHIVCKTSLQKGKNNFLRTNSNNVLTNLKTYGRLINHSDYLINLGDV